MVDHGRPWWTMIGHGQPWSTMVVHGRPCTSTVVLAGLRCSFSCLRCISVLGTSCEIQFFDRMYISGGFFTNQVPFRRCRSSARSSPRVGEDRSNTHAAHLRSMWEHDHHKVRTKRHEIYIKRMFFKDSHFSSSIFARVIQRLRVITHTVV